MALKRFEKLGVLRFGRGVGDNEMLAIEKETNYHATSLNYYNLSMTL